jgi:hypothetical protein
VGALEPFPPAAAHRVRRWLVLVVVTACALALAAVLAKEMARQSLKTLEPGCRWTGQDERRLASIPTAAMLGADLSALLTIPRCDPSDGLLFSEAQTLLPPRQVDGVVERSKALGFIVTRAAQPGEDYFFCLTSPTPDLRDLSVYVRTEGLELSLSPDGRACA